MNDGPLQLHQSEVVALLVLIIIRGLSRRRWACLRKVLFYLDIVYPDIIKLLVSIQERSRKKRYDVIPQSSNQCLQLQDP